MNNLSTIVELIKQHGIGIVVSVAMFLYFNDRITDVERKYENCMNDRIMEAIRGHRTSEDVPRKQRLYAILVEPVKVKRRETIA
jgi:hypothetical protein